MSATEPLLCVTDAAKRFAVGRRTVHALNGVSLSIAPGESVGLVGESGSGKTTLGRLILRLDELSSGTIRFEGRDITHLREGSMRRMRSKIQMVFQSPYASLNPRMTIGALIEEPLKLHTDLSRADRRREVQSIARRVALSEALLERHAGQASGGQLQRAAIGRAIATAPRLLVLDEPTSSLDLSVRAEILSLLASLREERGLAMLFISHDLETVHAICNRVCVMYLGRIVEAGARDQVFGAARHPYTRTLLSARLSHDPRIAHSRIAILGEPPSPLRPPAGCSFAARCPISEEACNQGSIALSDSGDGHVAACIKS